MAVRIRFSPFQKSPRRRRVLFTIAHYYGASPDGKYGSTRAAAAEGRRAALERTIAGLHQVVAQPQALVHGPSHGFIPANGIDETEIDVVVCTTGDSHLLDGLALPAGAFRHHPTAAEPRFLGFECHDVLRDALGRYDWYCYLEDDIGIEDTLFFTKLSWFAGWAGPDSVLQPNRFETSDVEPVRRLYIDGEPVKPERIGFIPDIHEANRISADALGVEVGFRRVTNAHSGCFFLTQGQMERWAAQPDFLKRETAFVGPLESAATLGLLRHFRVYKPVRANAGFLEVRHLHNRYLGALLQFV
ncbi:MAG: calcium-binding protein [Alphaproteobacteria bacterium]|nr:calcium-binding protein [Alphaproteobacteria bacterium]